MTTKACCSNCDVLIGLIDENIEYFDKKNNSLSLALKQLKNTTECCASAVAEVESFVENYDFDEETPASGYRSFIDVFESAIERTSEVCSQVVKVRGSFLFRADNYIKQINEWQQIIYGLSQIFDSLIQLHREKTNKTLFTYCTGLDTHLSSTGKVMNQTCFYRDNLGFQFCQSMQLIVKFLVVTMSSYSDFFFKKSSMVMKILNFNLSFTRLLYNPEDRAIKFLKTCENATPEFCRSYWFLTERRLVHTVPCFIAYKIDINKLFDIPAEPLQIYSEKFQKMVEIPLPRSHSGVGPVTCRLMSLQKRQGMFEETSNSYTAKASKFLIFHVHGGGFLSQTSKSHEIYLREWATKLDIPILSIDYSLAPEAPFPRAIEDVFYAYCWVLKNPELCGSTGENIVFVGDSAGGNLNTACILKCIESGIKTPKGILNIYTPFMLDYSISPSRFISLIDPIIPYRFSTQLHKSYCENLLIESEEATKVEFKTETTEDDSTKLQNIHLLSPFLASDEVIKEFPPTRLLSTTFDPFIDDCVEFGKRLRNLYVDVKIDILKGLPHGFLYFTQASEDCHNASMVCVERIKGLFDL